MVVATPLRERAQATKGVSDLTAGSRALRLLEGHGEVLTAGLLQGIRRLLRLFLVFWFVKHSVHPSMPTVAGGREVLDLICLLTTTNAHPFGVREPRNRFS